MDLKRLPDWREVAKGVSRLTGHSPFYHLADMVGCYVRYGCDEVQYGEGGFYRLSPAERRNTYTKQRAYALRPVFNPEVDRHLCQRKEEFNRFFARYVRRPWLYCRDASVEEIQAFIEAQPRVIVKQADAMQGSGIHALDVPADAVEGAAEGAAEVARSLCGQDVLLERWIDQHPDLCFGNASVNTIRVTTVRDPQGQVHLLKAVFRCGVGDAVVDNFTAGGVVYPLDLQRGVIEGPGTRKHSLAEGPIAIHPGTETPMVGRAIPFWPEALAMIRDVAGTIPGLRLIGWDIAITPEGPELVEGNTLPGPALLEYVGEKKGFYQEILSYR